VLFVDASTNSTCLPYCLETLVNAIVPAALIFVPSRDGLSHVPEEWTSVTDIATGARVLLELARRIDSQLHSMESAQA